MTNVRGGVQIETKKFHDLSISFQTVTGNKLLNVGPRVLPKLETQLAWKAGIASISEDQMLWPALWNANKAVAEAYGLNADDFGHILAAFPGFARKRPDFHAFFLVRLREWVGR